MIFFNFPLWFKPLTTPWKKHHLNNLQFGKDKVALTKILDTPFSRELRILLQNGQQMKSHTAPYPIIVHFLSGAIDFGVQGDIVALKTGDIITLESSIPHDLKAVEDSEVRLSLSKKDTAAHVKGVVS